MVAVAIMLVSYLAVVHDYKAYMNAGVRLQTAKKLVGLLNTKWH